MSNANTIRVNIRIPKEMYDYYKTKSGKTGVAMSALMYLDMENYLMIKKSTEDLPLLLAQLKRLEEKSN
jgi:hypothetical protein